MLHKDDLGLCTITLPHCPAPPATDEEISAGEFSCFDKLNVTCQKNCAVLVWKVDIGQYGRLRRYFRPRLFGHPLGAVLRAETYSFFLYFSLVALKNIRSMERLLDRLDGQPEVVFSHPHTFLTNTMNNFLRAHGFKTMTYNHGLIQGPLQSITETGINHSASRYDLEVMRKFSRDDTFKHVSVEAQPSPIRQDFRNNPKILILGSTFHPSIHFEYMRDYLSRLKDCILQTGLVDCPLLYKPHPRENRKRLAAYLGRIGVHAKVAGHDLTTALDQSNFAITHFSTVIIECIKMGVPFMVYQNFTESDETFFTEIPGYICFSEPKEFAEKYHALVQMAPAELNALYNDLYEKYYHGQPGQ